MWHKWFDGAWSDWEDLGAELASAPAVAARGPNRLDCFVQGTDNQLWRKSFTGSVWTEWEALGGTITEAPAAVARGLKRIDCLVRGAENNLWQKSWGPDPIPINDSPDVGGPVNGGGVLDPEP
jgi:sialidase-1